MRFHVPLAVLVASLTMLLASLGAGAAQGLSPVEVGPDVDAIDLTGVVQRFPEAGDRLTFRTAPDASGVVRRLQVRSEGRGSGDWITFALANPSDRQIDRLIVAPHFRMAGSGVWRPRLGSPRIASVTPSEGFALERVASGDADIFLITLDPGATVSFAAELATADLPSLTLWEPTAYERSVNAFTLYRGIIIGIAGLLAIFLTILFVVKGDPMFPGAATLAWAVFGYVLLDFGFLDALFALSPREEGFWRAVLEVGIAGGLVVFLFAYLALSRWNLRFWWLFGPWLLGLVALGFVATRDPSLAAGVARVSLALTGGIGLLLIGWLALRRYDRAFLLTPAWILLIAWLAGAYSVMSGLVDNPVAASALIGGLVLVVLLLTFTITQHAFAGGPIATGLVSDVERQALAVTGTGDAVFDWDVGRDRIEIDPSFVQALGLDRGALSGHPRDWLPHLHPDDRDRFRQSLQLMVERRRGQLAEDFRLRGKSGPYRWYRLRARPIVGSNGEVQRCVGALADVTAERVTEERLLRDAVHDNLTGLPNRSLFLDRVRSAIALAEASGPGERLAPTIVLVDLDRFAKLNSTFGLSVADSVLLTMARRLQRIAEPQDALSRIEGNRFAFLLLSAREPDAVARFCERVRRAVSTNVAFADEEIVATCSVGLSTWTPGVTDAQTLVSDAEIALMEAKRMGGDRVEPFRVALRNLADRDFHLEADLRRALDRGEIELRYQPIVHLDGRRVAGFEALLRWISPERGEVAPDEFIPLAERTGLITRLGAYALDRAAAEHRIWAKQNPDIFVSVNVSSRQLLESELLDEVRSAIVRHDVGRGLLKLEVTESLLLENPEQAVSLLTSMRDVGVGLSLDDFGTGYSSIAQLMRLPFDTLKIDRSLLSAGDRDVAKSVVQLGHEMGMAVVVEGIETEPDAERLRVAECEFGQGYLFGAPMTGAQALGMLKVKQVA